MSDRDQPTKRPKHTVQLEQITNMTTLADAAAILMCASDEDFFEAFRVALDRVAQPKLKFNGKYSYWTNRDRPCETAPDLVDDGGEYCDLDELGGSGFKQMLVRGLVTLNPYEDHEVSPRMLKKYKAAMDRVCSVGTESAQNDA